jgi:hypothetical protein
MPVKSAAITPSFIVGASENLPYPADARIGVRRVRSFADEVARGKRRLTRGHPPPDNAPMRRARHIPLLLAALAAAAVVVAAPDPPAAEPPATAPATAPATEAPPRRVIVHVDRNNVVPGYLQLEDDDVIVVRDLQGKLHSFAKARCAGVVRLVDPQPGQSGTVILRTGQRCDGVIEEDSFERVVVRVEGIPTTFRRASVDHVILEPTVRERYELFKSTLRPDMPDRHLQLCQWLLQMREYDLALAEVTELLSQHDLPEARQLLRRVEAQIALRDQPQREPGAPTVKARTVRADDERLISMEDVNLIRVFEIDFARAPKVVVRPETIEALIQRYATHPLIPESQTERQRLYRAEPLQIVKLMFQLHARDLYGQIRVQTEPYALNLFRQRVHNTWLSSNCATSRCHGGPDAGRLMLYRGRAADARVRYSNLLTLERLEIDPAWPLINYGRPRDSLIIQYGLPRQHARRPHPEAEGWKPAFRSPEDRMIRDAVLWIESMLQPRPDYPVEYELPIPLAAPRPDGAP